MGKEKLFKIRISFSVLISGDDEQDAIKNAGYFNKPAFANERGIYNITITSHGEQRVSQLAKIVPEQTYPAELVPEITPGEVGCSSEL